MWSHNNLINNLPLHIENVYIYFHDRDIKNIENLPPSIKKIIIQDEKYMKYITKVPFDCIVEIRKIFN